MKSTILTITGVIGGAISWLFGGWDTSIMILLICMLMDYISGLVVAGVFHKSKKTASGTLESRAGWKGLFKKGMTIFIVVVANLLDLQLATTFIRDAVCIAFITNEVISIIENAGLMGVPIPKVLLKMIDVLQSKVEEKEKEQGL